MGSLIIIPHVDAVVATGMIPIKEMDSLHHVGIRILIKVHFVIVQQADISSLCRRSENRVLKGCSVYQVDLIHCGQSPDEKQL